MEILETWQVQNDDEEAVGYIFHSPTNDYPDGMAYCIGKGIFKTPQTRYAHTWEEAVLIAEEEFLGYLS